MPILVKLAQNYTRLSHKINNPGRVCESNRNINMKYEVCD